jgi:tetratricopeptide (TPR) repeat protein
MPKIDNIDASNPEESIRSIGTPLDSIDHIFLGTAYFYLGEYLKAVEEFLYGLKLESERSLLTSVAVEELVTANCFLGNFRTARQVVIDFGHLEDPDYLPRLREFEHTGHWPESITGDCLQFVTRFWLETRGQKRPDLAEKQCIALTKLSPNNPDVRLTLGKAYVLQRKFDDAIDAFTQCIKLDPNADGALLFRALAYKGSGKFKECREDVEKIRHLNSSHPKLADLLKTLGLEL